MHTDYIRDEEGKIVRETEFEIDGIKMVVSSENKEIVNREPETIPFPMPVDSDSDNQEEVDAPMEDTPPTNYEYSSLKEFIDVPDEIKVVKIEQLSQNSVKLTWEPPCMNN